jgi:hypothetical protein
LFSATGANGPAPWAASLAGAMPICESAFTTDAALACDSLAFMSSAPGWTLSFA